MQAIAAELKAKPGKEPELESILRSLFDHVDREPGTSLYVLHRSPDDPSLFFFYEQYSDPAALRAHLASGFLRDAAGLMEPLLAAPPRVQVLDPIQSTDVSRKPPAIACSPQPGGAWTRRDLAGRQKEFCICWKCSRFRPELDDKGCPAIRAVLRLAAESSLVLPVWACPQFLPSPD